MSSECPFQLEPFYDCMKIAFNCAYVGTLSIIVESENGSGDQILTKQITVL